MNHNRPPLHVRLIAAVAWCCDRLGEVWHRAIWPLEWLVAAVLGKSLAATEKLENIESLLSLVGKGLLAPLRGVVWLLSKLVPSPVRSLLAALGEGLSYAIFWFGRGIAIAIDRFNLDAPISCIIWLTWPLWRPVAGGLMFAYAWLATRDARQLLYGLPAVVFAMPFLAVAWLGVVGGSAKSLAGYRMAYDEAAQREQYEAAQLYERKLAQLGADTRLSDYKRAIALVSDGKLAAAIAIMTRLAPSSRPGYPPAHFWMLDQIIAGNIDDDDPARGAAIDGHLEQLAKLSVDSPYLQLLRASRLLAKGQQSEAADMLRPLAGRLPQAAFQLLPLDVATADNATAQATAETVLRHLAAWPQSEAPFSAPMYRTWALALECLGRQSELDAVYRDWHETYPGDRRARARFARMVARDVEARLASPSTSPAALADIMQQACSLDLPPEWLTEQVRRLYATRDNAIIKSEIPEQTLVRLVDDPKTPIVLLEAIGSAAAQRAEWSRAEACFASITRRDARHAVGWNNWAWVLLQQADADLDQALEMANRAVALSPGAFRFRETRGQIYVRRQDWQPAVSDLQLAVNGMPNDKSIHASLATALAALGRHEEAAMHRQQTD